MCELELSLELFIEWVLTIAALPEGLVPLALPRRCVPGPGDRPSAPRGEC